MLRWTIGRSPAIRFFVPDRVFVILILIAGTAGGCQPSDSATPALAARPNILLVTVDTLRADHMPVYGYARDTTPNISIHFREAEVFDRALESAVQDKRLDEMGRLQKRVTFSNVLIKVLI